MLFGSCRAVRGNCASAGDARCIILPDDGSFSADTHVATQNTGIARTGSMLLRRRRGYVNWGVNAGRRDAYRRDAVPLCRQPRGRLRVASCRASVTYAARRPGCYEETRRYLCLLSSTHSKRERDEAQTRCNCVLRIYLFSEGENCTCIYMGSIERKKHDLVIIFFKNFGRYWDFLKSETSAYLFLRYTCILRIFLLL